MKKVAATSGQSVRRTDFFRLGDVLWAGIAGESSGRTGLAVANCDGFLLRRLTLSYSARAGRFGAFRGQDSESSAEVSSQCLMYGKFRRMQEESCEILREQAAHAEMQRTILDFPRHSRSRRSNVLK